VQQSRCLVLVQTRKVLTRPYCILELLTAIESQIPIVCVTVGGKPQEIAYNYEEMTKLMMWMDTELEHWNPGAADVLRDHGYEDLTDVAYRLSTTVPKTISVQLNTGDSRNRLHATIEDVVSAMKEAQVPNLPDKAAWLTARSKMAPPVPPAASPRKRSSSMPAIHEQSGGSAAAAVAALAGRGLIAQAATQPGLLPLAFAVQALASGAATAVVLQEECRAVAAAAAPLERLLVASANGADPSALQQVGAAVEALAALQARCSAKAAAPLCDASAFEPAKAALVAGVGSLRGDSTGGRSAANDVARALEGLPLAAPEPQPSAETTAVGALQVSQAQAEVARQQRELLEMQNKVLIEQVAQMQKMMTEQQMSMQSFMAKFPQAKDEPERRLVLLKKRLMDAPQSDFAKIDDLCRNIIESGSLGVNCRAVMFNVIGEDEARCLALCLSLEDGTVITSADLPAALVENRAARKASACQYVAASGEFKCVRADDGSKSDCFIMDIMAKGVDLANKDPALNETMKSLFEADPVFARSMAEMNMMLPLMANDGDFDAFPVVKRVAAKAQRALMKGAVSAVSGTNAGQFVKWMTSTLGATYLGAPVKCEGRTMGSFCTMFTGDVSEDLEMQLKEKLMRAAGRVGNMLDAI
jgi:hypothetical protein